MIERLIELVERDIDQVTQQLAAFIREQAELEVERAHWVQHLAPSAAEFDSIGAIRQALQYAARADRELKTLAEKDFLVEERICECRASLLAMARRRDALVQVLERRQKEADRQARRRLDREMAHRGAALKAAAAAQDLFGR